MAHSNRSRRGTAPAAALIAAGCAVLLVRLTGLSFTAAQGAGMRAKQMVAEVENSAVDRRAAVLLSTAPFLSVSGASPAEAAAVKTVVVAGATGQTGRRIVERLAKQGDLSVIGGVRDVAKAEKTLKESSIAVRGAMVDVVNAVDTSGVTLKKLDVAKDSVQTLTGTLQGADALIIATGFVPGNPFEMNKEAKAVDNEGTKTLVDAAKQAGVKKIVLVSSILTNGRAWGQEQSPGFVITNAFGNVLDEKLVAEKYLRASGIDWTIVRPGGLKATAPSGNLVVSKEDTLNTGEVSRDLVADVSIAAMFDDQSSNKVIEIIEDDKAPELPKSKWFAV